MKKIVLKHIIHHEKKRILLSFPYNKGDSYDIAIRKLPGRLWSRTYSNWHIPLTEDYYENVKQCFGGLDCEIVDLVHHDKNAKEQKEQIKDDKLKQEIKSALGSKESIPLVKYYTDSLRLKNYSPNTIDAYMPYFKQFVIHFGENEIDNLGIKQLHEYVKSTIEKQKLTEVPIKHLISAIKFYYEKIKGREKIYFTLSKKYEIKPVELKIKIEELVPFINLMKKPSEKLLILLKFHLGYSTKAIINKTIEEVNRFLQSTSAKKTDTYNILYETLKSYIETANSETYLFEKETGKQIEEAELDKHIFSIVSKYKIAAIYKYELNEAMIQAKFEETTRRVYKGFFLSFLKYYNYRHPLEITDKEIRKYLVEIRQVSELSTSYLNQLINVITFYYTKVRNRKIIQGTLIRPKREKKLPDVLSMNEFVCMVNKTENKKHRLAIILLYSLGLRRQELLDLKINDFDFSRNVVTVRSGKGKKDRQLAIPENLRIMVNEFIREFSPKKYIIEGGKDKEKYSATSIVNIVHDAAYRASVKKRVYPHILRHSIATHMIEQGIDVTFVKEFLGHESIKTTMRYTHLSSESKQKVRNPFDNLKFG
jgi:integrase/recombinase XerD